MIISFECIPRTSNESNLQGVFAMRPDYFIQSIRELAFYKATSSELTRIYFHILIAKYLTGTYFHSQQNAGNYLNLEFASAICKRFNSGYSERPQYHNANISPFTKKNHYQLHQYYHRNVMGLEQLMLSLQPN